METPVPPTVVILSTDDLAIIHLALEARAAAYRSSSMPSMAEETERLARAFARLQARSVYGDAVTLTAEG